jgi:uncharacterized protein (DUF1800 family)
MKLTPAELNHLYWRAAFGPRPADLHPKRLVPRKVAVDRLFAESATYLPWRPKDLTDYRATFSAEGIKAERQLPVAEQQRRQQARQAESAHLHLSWLQHLTDTPAQLRERMALFWHSHFANRQPTVPVAIKQVNTLQRLGLGKFGDLLREMIRDVGLLLSLNNERNRRAHPNENFARELLELFTIGRGHYTEQDVREAARAFTGWQGNTISAEFEFDERAHDAGTKTFMGKTGPWTGDDIVRIVLEQPQTAVFLTTKIYRWIVSDTPNPARIAELAKSFFASQYDIGALVRQILMADWFYEPAVRGARIKGPIELVTGLRHLTNADFPSNLSWQLVLSNLGQQLFFPPNVAGWPGGRSWIDSATLVYRLKLPQALFQEAKLDVVAKEDDDMTPNMGGGPTIYAITGNPSLDLAPLRALVVAHGLDPNAPDAAQLCELILPNPPRPALLELLRRIPAGPDALRQLTLRILSVPEYQVA